RRKTRPEDTPVCSRSRTFSPWARSSAQSVMRAASKAVKASPRSCMLTKARKAGSSAMGLSPLPPLSADEAPISAAASARKLAAGLMCVVMFLCSAGWTPHVPWRDHGDGGVYRDAGQFVITVKWASEAFLLVTLSVQGPVFTGTLVGAVTECPELARTL